MSERIILTIAKDGSVTVEGDGFSGPACDTILRKLAENFGMVTDVEHKPEFFSTPEMHRRTT